MSRDISGNYTLPAGNPVVTGTVIDIDWANPTMSDIATQLNNVLTRDGVLYPLAAFKLVDGNLSVPGLSFNNQVGTGLWNAASSAGYSFRGVAHYTSTTGLVTFGVPIVANVTGNLTGRVLGSDSSGSYTPTYSSPVGCTVSASPNDCLWTRIGDVVTVRGFCLVATDATAAATPRTFRMSLPVAIVPGGAIFGQAVYNATTAGSLHPVLVSFASNLASAYFYAPASQASAGCSFEFSYSVV